MMTGSIAMILGYYLGIELKIYFPIIACTLILGLIWIYYKARKMRTVNPQMSVILGSGGHTTEMCELLRGFNFEECGKTFVISGDSDKLSESFFMNFMKDNGRDLNNYVLIKTKRTNEVKQSKITSVFTTIIAFSNALYLITNKLLGVSHLISNGPGLSVPFFYIFWFLNKIRVTNTKLIFVESWCRVSTLSTAGKIISFVADEYIVHWEDQLKLSKRAKYFGKII